MNWLGTATPLLAWTLRVSGALLMHIQEVGWSLDLHHDGLSFRLPCLPKLWRMPEAWRLRDEESWVGTELRGKGKVWPSRSESLGEIGRLGGQSHQASVSAVSLRVGSPSITRVHVVLDPPSSF